MSSRRKAPRGSANRRLKNAKAPSASSAGARRDAEGAEAFLDRMSKVYSRELLRPFGPAAISIANLYKDAVGLDSPTLAVALEHETDAVHKGDMRRVEAMLVVQAHTLDALFNRMLRNMHDNQFELHMRMAFRAQAQCARTIEVLAAVRFPQSPQFIRQQNVAAVQQVNNGAVPVAARAGEEKLIAPNQLLEGKDAQRLDPNASPTTVGADPQVEAVGEIHRAANADGEGARVEERLQGRQATSNAGSGEVAAGASARPRSHRARPHVRPE